MATLFCRCQKEMDCPREIVIWNYFDHEHVVGTHYHHYHKVHVLAEKDGWCLCKRYYKLPIINLRASSLGFMWLESPNVIRSIQFGKFGLVTLYQRLEIQDLGPENCMVISEYSVEVPEFFQIFQSLFEKVIRRWFADTWDEDATMRRRRWKVWKLGFRDFSGLPYVNERTRASQPQYRPYPIDLPVPKSTAILNEVLERPFSSSTELGYSE